MTDLTKMFNPDSVAIVGASNSEGKVGYIIVNNMINDGFKGNIYPINPKDDEIQGLKAYKNVSDEAKKRNAKISKPKKNFYKEESPFDI